MCNESVLDLYDRRAHEYDRARSRTLQERAWLDQFLEHVRPQGTVLDLGCGTGEPIARYLIDRGFHVIGVDGSPAMIDLCRSRFPNSEWLVADMRALELNRRFEGILAWDSFFHLSHADQRQIFQRLASHAQPNAPLMFTSGPTEGEVTGVFCGEKLYHASLAPAEYQQLLANNGFVLNAHAHQDPQCNGHTVWLATHNQERQSATS